MSEGSPKRTVSSSLMTRYHSRPGKVLTAGRSRYVHEHSIRHGTARQLGLVLQCIWRDRGKSISGYIAK